MFAFSVYPSDLAYYFDEEMLVPIEIRPFGVAVKCRAKKTPEDVIPSVYLKNAAIVDGQKLRIFCEVYGSFCFCGLKISNVDLEDQSMERYLLSGTLPAFACNDTSEGKRVFSFDIDIPDGENTIVVTPAVYGKNTVCGEADAYYFSDGKLIDY